MFAKTFEYYDLIYSFKDYVAEAARIRALIRNANPNARCILDVACGTGEHAKALSHDFVVDGIDLEPGFVDIARRKMPSGSFHVADMRQFQLGKKYDVVQCLFSSIGYLTRGEEVVAALRCFKDHLAEGGMILVEPWLTPDVWRVGSPFLTPPVDLPEIKICRISVSGRDGHLSLLEFHYLIAKAEGVEYRREDHRLALYTVDEMLGYFREAGLNVSHETEGIFGRGMYTAVRAE